MARSIVVNDIFKSHIASPTLAIGIGTRTLPKSNRVCSRSLQSSTHGCIESCLDALECYGLIRFFPQLHRPSEDSSA